MDAFLVADSGAVSLRRESVSTARSGVRGAQTAAFDPEGVWERLRAHIAAIPEHEYERQRRLSVRHWHTVDSTHPPTHLRRACLLTGPPVAAAVVLDGARGERVAAELAGARAALGRRIVRDGYDE
jgi:hypothetical protein